MACPFARSIYADTHRSGIQRSRDWWSDSAFGAGDIGNEDRSWSDGRPLQSNEPADLIPAQILSPDTFYSARKRSTLYCRLRLRPAVAVHLIGSTAAMTSRGAKAFFFNCGQGRL